MNEANEFLEHVVTRRQLLRAGAAGVGSLALQSMLAPDALAKQIQSSGLHFAPKAKRIIFLLMNGAPPQHDLFVSKPEVAKH